LEVVMTYFRVLILAFSGDTEKTMKKSVRIVVNWLGFEPGTYYT